MTEAADSAQGPWRLLGLDIDGTLMHWGGDMSAAVLDAIERVRLSDTHVVLATGRNIPATLPVARALGIRRGWAVCSNGAVTLRLSPRAPGGYEIVEKVTFNPRAALELIRTEMPHAMYAVEEGGDSFRVSHPFPLGELAGTETVVQSFDDLCHDEATRVVVRAPGAQVHHMDEMARRIGLNDVTYAVGYSAWLDLTPAHVTKASALEGIRARLGVAEADTYAVGDGNNDIDMLRWATHSAAMGNAPSHVQAAANRTLASVLDDGVLGILEPLIESASRL